MATLNSNERKKFFSILTKRKMFYQSEGQLFSYIEPKVMPNIPNIDILPGGGIIIDIGVPPPRN
jgi:hypothetical protein